MEIINNNIELEHLGSGVCIFRKAFSANWTALFETAIELVDLEHENMYLPTIHPETGEMAYINKSGYLFNSESMKAMPRRGSAIHRDSRPQIAKMLQDIETIKDLYLLKYFEYFPLAYNCVWWKVKGHLVSYSPGVYLGPHSDISAEYVYGVHQTSQELALRNVITSLTYLNSLSDENSSDNYSFTGGEHVFSYLGITYLPRAGDIMMFPSNYVAAHEVRPVTSGRRISYLGWYSQGTPNQEVGESVCDPKINPDGAQISTNVYMPTLRNDYREFLKKRGYDESSEQFNVTRLVGEE
jgi:hypothetical protein